MSNYDSWLEAPYQRSYGQRSSEAYEAYLGGRVVAEKYWGTIEDMEVTREADEDGTYDVVTFIVRLKNGREAFLSLDDVRKQLGV